MTLKMSLSPIMMRIVKTRICDFHMIAVRLACFLNASLYFKLSMESDSIDWR